MRERTLVNSTIEDVSQKEAVGELAQNIGGNSWTMELSGPFQRLLSFR